MSNQAERFTATLLNGETWTNGTRIFRRGDPMIVDRAERDRLMTHAIDTGRDGVGNIVSLQKFSFVPFVFTVDEVPPETESDADTGTATDTGTGSENENNPGDDAPAEAA